MTVGEQGTSESHPPMSLSNLAFRPRGAATATASALERERSIRRRIFAVWGLLYLNVLGYTGTLIHIPSTAGKIITQGALLLAFFVALTINRKVVIRPNVFLCLVSLLVLGTLLTFIDPQHLGTVFRTLRLGGFVTVLWLLTPWWGRRDLLLVRCYLTLLAVTLGSVVLGLIVVPGKAIAYGRLGGVLWGIPATQVAHYAAVATGLVLLLWIGGRLSARRTLYSVVPLLAILILTHTRTALVAMVAGVLVGGLSLIKSNARVRKFFASAGAITGIAILTLSSVITTWLARGEGTTQLADLTGRTKVWGPLLAAPRSPFEMIFGFGLSNGSFNGLPIDSNWLSSYQEQGLWGVTICVAILVFLLVTAYFQPRGVERAIALFLTTYCLLASFTEDGFTDATPYLLEITLAASLIVHSARSRSQV
jgi:hypothetical protein